MHPTTNPHPSAAGLRSAGCQPAGATQSRLTGRGGLQTARRGFAAPFVIWNLSFGIYLGFGHWDLGFLHL